MCIGFYGFRYKAIWACRLEQLGGRGGPLRALRQQIPRPLRWCSKARFTLQYRQTATCRMGHGKVLQQRSIGFCRSGRNWGIIWHARDPEDIGGYLQWYIYIYVYIHIVYMQQFTGSHGSLVEPSPCLCGSMVWLRNMSLVQQWFSHEHSTFFINFEQSKGGCKAVDLVWQFFPATFHHIRRLSAATIAEMCVFVYLFLCV